MSKINIEIDESYKEKLDLLRKVFVSPEGKELENNWELVWALIDTFVDFVQSQAEEHSQEWDSCEHWGCGCSH